MIITTFIFACVLLVALGNINPRTAQWTGFVLVTASIFLFVASFIGTFLLSLRRIRKKDKPLARSLRQASFFSIAVIVALYLQRFDLLSWWNMALLVGLVILIEIFFISKEDIVEV